MKKLVKDILRPVKNLAQVYFDYYNGPLNRKWYLEHSKRLLKFKEIHKGEDCFIIGNGPSLNKMDLSPLRKYHTFGLNKIYMMFDKVDLNLSYLVATAPQVIKQSVKEFEALKCPCLLSYEGAHNVINSSLDHIHFIAVDNPYFTFQPDLRKNLCGGHTVTYVTMQIAFYMGFSKVFLIGVDHNFTARGKPNEIQILQGDDPNHFAPGYFGNQEWQLPDLEASELSYHLARFHFNRDERQIYDATVDGKLQIFQKIPFKQALDMCRKK